jgi:hypothetical protein
MLAAQRGGDLGRHPAQYHAVGVNDIPLSFYILFSCHERSHFASNPPRFSGINVYLLIKNYSAIAHLSRAGGLKMRNAFGIYNTKGQRII